MNPLELWPISAIRRNHALEHATIHVLSERHPGLRVVGRSDWGGFTLFGPLDTANVASAVAAALQRLRAGECHLAVHPSCGTNVSTAVVLAGLASFAALHGKRRSRLEKALRWIPGLAAALVLAQPLGVRVQQRLTTSADVQALRVSDVRRQQRGSMVVHRIRTVLE